MAGYPGCVPETTVAELTACGRAQSTCRADRRSPGENQAASAGSRCQAADRRAGRAGGRVRVHRRSPRGTARGPRLYPASGGRGADRADRRDGPGQPGRGGVRRPHRQAALLRGVLRRRRGRRPRRRRGRAAVGSPGRRDHRHAVDRRGRQRAGDHAGAGDAGRRGRGHGGGVRALQHGRRGCGGAGRARGDPARPRSRRRRGKSRGVVRRMAGLFAVDAAGGGLVTTGFLSYYFAERYHAPVTDLGWLFFAVSAVQAVSVALAPRLARRFGLVATMVGTHLPSNVLLAAVAFAPTYGVAAAVTNAARYTV